MPVRKLKPIEAGDGSYAGLVLQKFDEMEGQPCSCCDRVGEYNGYGSDGPTTFTCPKSCPCHD